MAEVLAELAVPPQVRVVVATRPMAGGRANQPSGLLRTLGVTSTTSSNLVDLDTDRYFDPAGLTEFSAALLEQEGAVHPGPVGGAWTRYRQDPPPALATCRRHRGSGAPQLPGCRARRGPVVGS